jgi:hypothetical protein
MSKSKLEILLEAIDDGGYRAINNAYQAYMEERKTLPQAGQEIEVWDVNRPPLIIHKFIGFTTDGRVVSEDINGVIGYWKHYRIPKPKKKYKVVKDTLLGFMILPFNTPMPNAEIITTFED